MKTHQHKVSFPVCAKQNSCVFMFVCVCALASHCFHVGMNIRLKCCFFQRSLCSRFLKLRTRKNREQRLIETVIINLSFAQPCNVASIMRLIFHFHSQTNCTDCFLFSQRLRYSAAQTDLEGLGRIVLNHKNKLVG